METKKENRQCFGELQFENFPERTDIQVSKSPTTAKGDKIRVIATTGQNAVLIAIGRRDGDTVTVIGEPEVLTAPLLGEIWDVLKSLAAIGVDLLTRKGGCTPVTTSTVEVDKDGHVTKITVTTTCVPN